MPEHDGELVARACDGCQDAFRVLADKYAGQVFNLIFRLVRDRGVADELAQDSFVKAFAALRSFDPALRFSPWLLRIAHNTAIDHLRRRRLSTVSIDHDPDGSGPHPVLADTRERSPLEQTELAHLRAALDWALDQLRPEYRRMVVLRYQEDQSYDEIASTVGLPLGTVKSHLHRARQAMARLLDEAGWGRDAGQAVLQPSDGQDS